MNLASDRRPAVLRELRRPMYILEMNWERMGDEARRRWLENLKVTCRLVAAEIEGDLK